MVKPRPALLALGVSLVGLFAQPAAALHRESQPVTRLSLGAPHAHPIGRHFSTNSLAFVSTADLLGTGSTGPQLYLFDLLEYDCSRFTTRPSTPCPPPPWHPIHQLTSGAGNPSNPSLIFDDNVQVVAFEADGVFAGANDPGAGHRQIFLLNLKTGELNRVTRSPLGDSVRPAVTRSGTIVVFESNAPLAGPPRYPGVSQVFAFRIRPDGSTQLVRLADGAAPSTGTSVDRAGVHIAFQSAADLLGDGRDTGIAQVFVAEMTWPNVATSPTVKLTQITRGNGPSIRPYLPDTLDFLAFESAAADFPATTRGPGSSIYTARIGTGSFPAVEQVTTPNPYGNCHFPALGSAGDRLAFICDGDPLRNGTTGNRAFVLALPTASAPGTLYQITGRGDVQGPLGLYLGRDFVTLADDTDLTGGGTCDRQLYIVDFYKDPKSTLELWHAAHLMRDLPQDVLPPLKPPGVDSNLLGNHNFDVDPTAGTAALVTTAGPIAATLGPGGRLRLEVGARSVFTGEAPVTVPVTGNKTVLPPVIVPGLGAFCLRPKGPGSGVIDCDGGRADGSLTVQRHHGGNTTDPGCAQGCVEGVPGSTCDPPGPHAGVCREQEAASWNGSFTPGEMQLFLPVDVSLDVVPGFDGQYCTGDASEAYAFRNVPLGLYLTSSSATGAILGADAAAGATVASSAAGLPFDCRRLAEDEINDAQLVGFLPLIDLPNVGGALHDVLLSLRFAPTPPPRGTCNPTVCMRDADCSDGDPCDGVEICQNHTCVAGTPACGSDPCSPQTCTATSATTFTCTPGAAPNCDDGSACTADRCVPGVGCVSTDLCAGPDPCSPVVCIDPVAGTCGPATPPTCDDANPCTTDGCMPGFGCTHAANTASCDDGDGCTLADACAGGICAGTPVQCDDGDVCNGIATCTSLNAASFVCAPGAPPNCDDGNPCTDDACDLRLGCLHTFNTAPCDDGNPCTGADGCRNGACTGTLRSCDDGNPCNGTESCDPATGSCTAGAPPSCDDGDECTADGCDPVAGCTHAPVGNYRSCRLAQSYVVLGQMATQIARAPAAQLGGPSRQRRLLVLVRGAQSRLQVAGTAAAALVVSNLRRAERRLTLFGQTLQRGMGTGRVDRTLGMPLRQAASVVLGRVQTLRLAVP